MSLGKMIKDLRKESGLTQLDLATAINHRFDTNINKSMLSKWENDKEVPHLSYVKCIALFFNVSLDYLLENKYEKLDPNAPSVIIEQYASPDKINEFARLLKLFSTMDDASKKNYYLMQNLKIRHMKMILISKMQKI